MDSRAFGQSHYVWVAVFESRHVGAGFMPAFKFKQKICFGD